MTAGDIEAVYYAAVQVVSPAGQQSRVSQQQSRVSQQQSQLQRRITQHVQRSSQGKAPVPGHPQDEQRPDIVGLNDVEQLAVARFWELLADFTVLRADFTVLHAAPRQWVAVVSASHPLLHPDELRTELLVKSGN